MFFKIKFQYSKVIVSLINVTKVKIFKQSDPDNYSIIRSIVGLLREII